MSALSHPCLQGRAHPSGPGGPSTGRHPSGECIPGGNTPPSWALQETEQWPGSPRLLELSDLEGDCVGGSE